MRKLIAGSTLLVVVFSSGMAGAALVEYSDRAAFSAAADTEFATEDFEGFGLDPEGSGLVLEELDSMTSVPGHIYPGDIPNGVSFTSDVTTETPPDDIYIRPKDSVSDGLPASDLLVAYITRHPIICLFGEGTTAVGFDVFVESGNPLTPWEVTIIVTDSIGNTTSYSRSTSYTEGAFFGVFSTSGTIIDEIRVEPVKNVWVCIDNFAFDGTPPIPGDLNMDDTVNSRDLDIVRAWWGATVEPGNSDRGDATGDGLVNSNDLDLVRSNWGTGIAAVPEPSAVFLVLVGGGLLVCRRF